MEGPQTDDVLDTRSAPAHASPFRPLLDQIFAQALNGPRANGQLLGHKTRIVHAGRIASEIVMGDAENVSRLRTRGVGRLQGREHGWSPLVIERVGERFDPRRTCVRHGIEGASDGPEVLVGMEDIDNLNHLPPGTREDGRRAGSDPEGTIT